ncbi:MAG: hypothetical protein KAI27_01725 [Rhodospirillaceae bacterium]|nr:hypothetical protein [Rhodospirillaceae bacterium]
MLRSAIPFVATILSGWFISDVFNERQAAKQANMKVDYPAIVQNVAKRKADFWKFLAVAGLITGAISAFLIKKLK